MMRKVHAMQIQQEQNKRARELIDAMEYAVPGTPERMQPETINSFITSRIEQHRKMIKTLEWFGAHLGLDQPETDTLVQRVIYEGLNSLMKDRLKGNL